MQLKNLRRIDMRVPRPLPYMENRDLLHLLYSSHNLRFSENAGGLIIVYSRALTLRYWRWQRKGI